ILLDELRGVSKDKNYYINDIDFFANGTNKASLRILKDNKELYQLRDKEKLQAFRNLDENNETHKAIDCYNTCIDILSDIAKGNMNTDKKTNTYHAKYRELLEKLNIIGHNNIKAMYVGVNEEKKLDTTNNKSSTFLTGITTLIGMSTETDKKEEDDDKPKPPKAIGRLATTIIMEDGLWIG
ncbi:hypothetical protein CQA53_11110, partial [Helicobacter didelphidarum]